jgi:hypothetical protein
MINELWDKIIQTSKNLKKDNENFDGLNFWKSFKQQLLEMNKKISKKIIWNYQSHDVLRMSFNDFINDINIDKDNDDNLIEWKHFIRQILWIPHKDNGEFSFHRLMQIALNYGQLLGSLDKITNAGIKAKVISEGIFLSDITKYITQENLNNITLTEEEFNSINDILEGYESTVDITQTENVTTDVITTEADDDEITSAQITDTTEVESSEDVLSSDFPQNGGHKRYYINYQ